MALCWHRVVQERIYTFVFYLSRDNYCGRNDWNNSWIIIAGWAHSAIVFEKISLEKLRGKWNAKLIDNWRRNNGKLLAILLTRYSTTLLTRCIVDKVQHYIDNIVDKVQHNIILAILLTRCSTTLYWQHCWQGAAQHWHPQGPTLLHVNNLKQFIRFNIL